MAPYLHTQNMHYKKRHNKYTEKTIPKTLFLL